MRAESGTLVTYVAIPEDYVVVEIVWKGQSTNFQLAEIEHEADGENERYIRWWTGTESVRFPLHPVLAALTQAYVAASTGIRDVWERRWSGGADDVVVTVDSTSGDPVRGLVVRGGDRWGFSVWCTDGSCVVELMNAPGGAPGNRLPLAALLETLAESSVRLDANSSYRSRSED